MNPTDTAAAQMTNEGGLANQGVDFHEAPAADASAAAAAAAAKQELIEATRRYLQVHPVASMGVALAAGYLLSRILASR